MLLLIKTSPPNILLLRYNSVLVEGQVRADEAGDVCESESDESGDADDEVAQQEDGGSEGRISPTH